MFGFGRSWQIDSIAGNFGLNGKYVLLCVVSGGDPGQMVFWWHWRQLKSFT